MGWPLGGLKRLLELQGSAGGQRQQKEKYGGVGEGARAEIKQVFEQQGEKKNKRKRRGSGGPAPPVPALEFKYYCPGGEVVVEEV